MKPAEPDFANVPVLLVADTHDDLQGMVAPLRGAVTALQVMTQEDQALDLVAKGEPLILLLGFSTLEASQVFYLRALKRSSHERLDMLQTVLLCDRTEAQRSYHLCRDEVVDDYLVARPLYHPHQLSLTLKMARDRLTFRRLLTNLTGPRPDQKSLKGLLEDLDTVAAPVAHSNPRLQRAVAELRIAALDLSTHLEAGAQLVERARTVRSRAGASSAPVAISSPSLTPDGPAVQPGSSGTVLVVEDDDFFVEVVREILESSGFRVLVARNGAFALSLLRIHRVDVVLMDVELPKMSGLEAMRRIRQMPALRDLPVIVLTGHSEEVRVIEAVHAGASGFIVKPGSRVSLLEKIASCRAAADAHRASVAAQGGDESLPASSTGR